MTELGALLAGLAAASLVLASRAPSRVARHLELLAGPLDRSGLTSRWRVPVADLAHSGLGWSAQGLVLRKIGGAVGAAGGVIALLHAPLAALVAAYLGYVAPSLLVERRSRERRAEALAALATVVERAEALVASGRPPEHALASLSSRRTGAPLLDGALTAASADYALGAPLFRSLASAARANGVAQLAALADELDRARDLGRGSLAVLADARDSLRAAERTRALDAAARVEGRLMLVLVLCYMPALMLAVVIPLFLGLLEGLSG